MLQRYIDAHARADAAAVIELLGDDVSFSMPTVVDQVVQEQTRFDGHQAVAAFFHELFGADNPGEWRLLPTRANGQPAAANYLRRCGDDTYRADHTRRAADRRRCRGRDHDVRRLGVHGVRASVDPVMRASDCAPRLSLLSPTVLLRLRAVGHRPATGRQRTRSCRPSGAMR